VEVTWNLKCNWYSLSNLFVILSAHSGFHRLKSFSLLDSVVELPAFHNFLFAIHNTLEHLDVQMVDMKSVEAWLAGIAHGFPSLHSLVVQSPPSIEGINALNALLRSTTSLSKLMLVGCLENEDIPVLFSTLSSSNLRILEFTCPLVTLPLFNLLAGIFPHLEGLKIVANQDDEVNIPSF